MIACLACSANAKKLVRRALGSPHSRQPNKVSDKHDIGQMDADAHVSRGWRSLLSHPRWYNLLQELLGANAHRRKFYHKYLQLRSDARVLDVGCGTGILASLIPEDIEYIGCDMEARYIEYARTQHSGRHTFMVENIGGEVREEWRASFDLVNAHGLLHHLNDADGDALLQTCHAYLRPGGRMLTVDGVFHEGQSKLSRWMVSQDRGQNIRTPKGYLDAAQRYFSSVDGFVDDKYTRILPYSVFIMILQR